MHPGSVVVAYGGEGERGKEGLGRWGQESGLQGEWMWRGSKVGLFLVLMHLDGSAAVAHGGGHIHPPFSPLFLSLPS